MATPIVETARSLRRVQTSAEKVFWEQVRGRRFLGMKFTRQFPTPVFVDGQKRFFIADFYCFEERLMVEIDGSIHQTQQDYDQLRTEILNVLGFKILRYTNEEILSDIKSVMKSLEITLNKSPSLKERG
jgi:very-short-patch-repair endonuclease